MENMSRQMAAARIEFLVVEQIESYRNVAGAYSLRGSRSLARRRITLNPSPKHVAGFPLFLCVCWPMSRRVCISQFLMEFLAVRQQPRRCLELWNRGCRVTAFEVDPAQIVM